MVMKPKRTILANILCDAYGKPFKMIVVDGKNTTEIPISNSTLKVVKKSAKQIFGATDIFVSLVQS